VRPDHKGARRLDEQGCAEDRPLAQDHVAQRQAAGVAADVVRSDVKLSELAPLLESTMGWYGGHLHQFEAAGKR